MDIASSAERENDSDFERYFESSHMDFLTDARQRLAELDAMPRTIYTVGLSVGGATALALAADQPSRIKRVVSFAPLLKIFDPQREKYVNLAGPLDIIAAG